MVATWTPAASAGYYSRQTGYYAGEGGVEPAGRWYAPAGDHGIVDRATVDTALFERLFAGLDADGKAIVPASGNRLDRVPAFDVTLSAPRSVSLIWALGDERAREAIEAAHAQAVRHTLDLLEREAAFARRGRNGGRIEKVALSAACFRHGESRPAGHADGAMFADPNLHTHCVVLNLASRGDGSVGALHSTILRDWKMAAGAAYHATLAAGLMEAGFAIDRISRNGIFEIAGVGEEAVRYFSARRQEIVAELAEAGVVSGDAAALAATVAKTTRAAKTTGDVSREEEWAAAARRIGFDAQRSSLRMPGHTAAASRDAGEELLRERLTNLPDSLTDTRSVLDRRDLFRGVAEAFVGTGVAAERIETEVARLLEQGHIVELGCDRIGLSRYSTPEMVRIEREIVGIAAELARLPGFEVEENELAGRCRERGLSDEQRAAVLDAAGPGRLAVVEGAPGTGKTTLLSPVVDAWKAAGYRVVGTATAWRTANALRDDLAIEARATASWLARSRQGLPFLDERTVLIVDEVGLLSSREMHALLCEARDAGAKVLLAGDRGQLQAIGAGSGLRLVAHAVETARVERIVRQHEAWTRDAVTAFGRGEAETALAAFAERDLLIEADDQAAAIRALVDRVEDAIVGPDPDSVLLIAKTNAETAAIGKEVRDRLRDHGVIAGQDVGFDAVTPSGHTARLALAAGDHIRFLVRNDDLGVVNGTTAIVTGVTPVGTDPAEHSVSRAFVEARIGDRLVRFDTADIADEHGRAKLGWAYASTIYGAQGATVDRAAVLVTPAFDRHDIYVAASRARHETALVVDRRRVEQEMRDRAEASLETDAAERRRWLAKRLSVAHVKETTLDVVDSGIVTAGHPRTLDAPEKHDAGLQRGMSSRRSISRQHSREVGLEL